MQLVTVLYSAKDGATFNFEYYMKKHVPWVSGLVGQPIEVRRGLSSPTGAAAPFVCLATIHIKSFDEFKSVLAKHGAQIMADIPNYTNIEPIIQFDEVLT
jgi:uncharacterized protein (TIGR02118 family)